MSVSASNLDHALNCNGLKIVEKRKRCKYDIFKQKQQHPLISPIITLV